MLIEERLAAGDVKGADRILEKAESEYDSNSRVLYAMDRGMTLHLAGEYERSNAFLEEAEEAIEDLYTRRIHTEVTAFLVNDTKLPFEGEPFEQVWINVTKALNFALLGQLDEALVEARRIDHRLNVLADRVIDKTKYREDPFARYVSGLLYEINGEFNDAFIAYRKAYEGYTQTRSWSGTPVPPMLQTDLLRVTDALGLTQEHDTYRKEFGDLSWKPWSELQGLAQVIVISYNGRAPQKEDQFVDLPISMDALKLVLLTKALKGPHNDQNTRAAESVLYGLNGRVVRVALPKLVPQKTTVAYSQIRLTGAEESFRTTTHLVNNVTANAEKALSDRYTALAIKAVGRAAAKFALAEGIGRGTRAAFGKDRNQTGQLIGLIVSIIAKSLAVASEEADKRNWRTLPDEIHIGRLWVPPGHYDLGVKAITESGTAEGKESVNPLILRKGEAHLVVQRVMM